MNLIEACKEMVEKGGEYIYREGDGEWLHRFYDHECSRTFLEQTCKGSPWTEKDAQLTKEDIFATDWQVHYKDPKLKPCPFCGDEKVKIAIDRILSDCDFYWVNCYVCRVSTMGSYNKQKIMAAWNRRDGEEK